MSTQENAQKDPFTEDLPDWVWILTIQDTSSSELHGFLDKDEEDDDDDDDFDLAGDIVGCYTTKALMYADMKRLGENRYGIFHMKVEGWKKEEQN